MVVYDRLWKTMREKGITQYRLIKYYGFSCGQIDRLKKNAYVSTHTIDVLCTILNCRVEDIMEFRRDAAYNPGLGVLPENMPLTRLPDKYQEVINKSAAISDLDKMAD